MRILHVGYFGLKSRGAAIHSVSYKLSRGFVRAGHAVIDFSDRDVARASTVFGARKFGVRGVNRALLQAIRDMEPDLLVLGQADMIRAATIAQARREQPRMQVVQWNVDPLFEPANVAALQSKLDVVDATLVSTAGAALAPLQRPGKRVAFLPNPVDLSIESGCAHLNRHPASDIFYACGNPHRPLRRVFDRLWQMDAFFAEFARLAPELRCTLPGMQGAGTVSGAAYQRAMEQCAMGLNLSRRNDVLLYSSDRLAQMAGNGLAILVERSTGYDRLFSPSEMAFFTNFDTLVATARELAASPERRMDIAAAGRRRYHALFNETTVARYMIEVAFGTLDPGSYEWPTLYP